MKKYYKLISIIMGMVLIMQISGCGSNNKTWAGYEADVADGLRVKEVKFAYAKGMESYVKYDEGGNIISSRIYCYGNGSFFEKVFGIQVPFEYSRDSYMMNRIPNRSLNQVNIDNWEKRSTGGTIYSFEDEHGQDIYMYLADGRIVEHQFFINREWGREWYSIKYIYDNKGRLIKEVQYDSDGVSATGYTTYTYEGNSLYLQRVSIVDYRGNSIRSYKYTYDNNNNIIRIEEYEEFVKYGEQETGGELTNIWEYEYDESGNVYVSSGISDYKTVTKYDGDGNIIESCVYQTFGSKEYIISKTEYKYNSYDYLVRETTYKYEANSNYSTVNLISESEGNWEKHRYAYWDNKEYDDANDCWTVTYYSQEEIDRYMHDQEFQRVN